MTGTSTVGNVTESERGYTLIELSVVVLIIGTMLLIAVPRVRDTLLNDDLKVAARRLIGAAQELRNAAVREQTDYLLRIDLGEGAYWTYPADTTPEKLAEIRKDALRLPEGVRISDIRHANEVRQVEGEALIRFFRQGYVSPTIIRMARDERTFTLVFQPFLPNVTVHEEHVDFFFNQEDRYAGF